jgi:hypothetical protein
MRNHLTKISRQTNSTVMAEKPRRDNFKQSVIDILFKRSGGKCCMCRATTFGPHTGRHDKFQNIGQAAHISAAAPGGPRYDPKMAAEERTSAKNGMWLCSNCHSQIDRDTDRFTLTALRKIKRDAEDRARKEVGVADIVSSLLNGSLRSLPTVSPGLECG